ncbi:MAG TPA: hypothetical protein GXZ70_03050 [Clostridiales bacterium]|nr:hypothetical protein [Clostridiales bacterium]
MGFNIRMKTGFYETKLYNLQITKEELILSPIESDDSVDKISEESILNITLIEGEKASGIEIQTNGRIYECLLTNKMDYELLLTLLKENINKKIICEFEGGH